MFRHSGTLTIFEKLMCIVLQFNRKRPERVYPRQLRFLLGMATYASANSQTIQFWVTWKLPPGGGFGNETASFEFQITTGSLSGQALKLTRT